jgi:hypothetical protein
MTWVSDTQHFLMPSSRDQAFLSALARDYVGIRKYISLENFGILPTTGYAAFYGIKVEEDEYS